jgi:hypothetical protein
MTDPWSFGWTQLFTLIGFAVTISIAYGGFRTFERWKLEKIEEKRIDTAIEALALAYESKFIFDHIRGAMSYSTEWEQMPQEAGNSEQSRQSRGPFYAVLKRIEGQKEFFDRAWKLQVRCAALFGPSLEDTFLLLQKARREVEVSAGMLYRDPYPQHNSPDNLATWAEWRSNVWKAGSKKAGGDDVTRQHTQFLAEIEAACRPTVDREFKRTSRFWPWQ